MLGCTPPATQPLQDNLLSPSFTCNAATFLELESTRVIAQADVYLKAEPRTVTADRSPRTEGGPNDFYSEGDYWWPVPGQPDASYERRDGQSNPDNFIAHRQSMIRLSEITASLAAAWQLTGEAQYAEAANPHFRAWFIDPETRMNPSLLYAQAIKGRHSGRSIGLIDTLHLVEVARAAKVLGEAGQIPAEEFVVIKAWFSTFATWMNTHPYGIKERDWHNNHAIAWGLQVAAFSDLTGDVALAELVRTRFKTVYIAKQMRIDGAFPDELSRTKPYGYSLFVLDLLGGIAQILSTPEDNLWTFQTADGRGLEKAIDFMYRYVEDKSRWPLGQDIAYWEAWPMRHPAYVFAGNALGNCAFSDLVRDFPTDSDVYEVTRNFPIRYPSLWLSEP
jgi:hypothetical protein